MPTASSKERAKPRAKTVISIPKENNCVYGPDVPISWQEAAVEVGMAPRTFWGLIEQREIARLYVGRRAMLKPSAIRAYLKTKEVAAV